MGVCRGDGRGDGVEMRVEEMKSRSESRDANREMRVEGIELRRIVEEMELGMRMGLGD